MTDARTCVDVATVWTSPDAPREIDAPALADAPDLGSWVGALDAHLRHGLHGRTLTQLLEAEPVTILEEAGDWLSVAAPWQPNPADGEAGYVGWVRRAHVEEAEVTLASTAPVGSLPRDREAVLSCARGFLGLRYLWGGLSPYGLDCSGLVHYAYRQAGVVVPRDAHVQAQACEVVALGRERPGDLYFFAPQDGRVSHVGFVTGERAMLHAPEGGGLIEDAPLGADRVATLVSAGRFLPHR